MSAAAAVKKKSVYDPSKQWGLKPENNFGESGGATYVVSGHVVSGGSSQSMFVGESVGRDAQAKAARQVSAKDADRALQRLLKRDKEGMKAVLVARDHIRKHSKPVPNCAKKDKKPVKGPSKGSSLETETEDEDSEINLDDALADDKKVKKGYSTNLIRSLGFDPASRDGSRPKDLDVQKKVYIHLNCSLFHADPEIPYSWMPWLLFRLNEVKFSLVRDQVGSTQLSVRRTAQWRRRKRLPTVHQHPGALRLCPLCPPTMERKKQEKRKMEKRLGKR